MEVHYNNEPIYAGEDELTSRRDDVPPWRQRSNFKEVSNTTPTQNCENTAITKMNIKLRIVFSVMAVFLIATVAVFGVQAYWISRQNIQDIELNYTARNVIRTSEDKTIAMIKELNDNARNDIRTSEDKTIAMIKDFMKKVRRYPGICYVGISTGFVKLSQLSASSVHVDRNCRLNQAILNSGGAWCANKNQGDEWIQVDYLVARTITAILTQGRVEHGQWVASYQLSYGNTTSEMQYYQEFENVKVFVGNSDVSTIVENDISPPIHARFVRIHPMSYHKHKSMRIEMTDC